jgi:hypothetical protein
LETTKLEVYGSKDNIQRWRSNVSELQHEARSVATQKIYDNRWREFEEWCNCFGYSPLPSSSQTILDYIGWVIELDCLYKVVPVLASISLKHLFGNFTDPTKDFQVI